MKDCCTYLLNSSIDTAAVLGIKGKTTNIVIIFVDKPPSTTAKFTEQLWRTDSCFENLENHILVLSSEISSS